MCVCGGGGGGGKGGAKEEYLIMILGFFSLVFHKNVWCGYSLEAPL